MKQHQFLTLISIFLIKSITDQQIKHTVFFANDNYQISASEKTKLNTVISKLAKFDIKNIQLSGHTDHNHSHEYNIILSKNRATAVKNFFKNQNTYYPAINMDYKGEDKPLISNTTNQGRAMNRRVEIIFRYKPKALSAKDIQSIRDKLVPAQLFVINPNKDNILYAKDSSIILIPKNIFILKNGNDIKGNITISLREYINKVDILMGGMNTSSNGQILESGGTINIEASDSNKKELIVKNGKSFTILFPTNKIQKDMQFFEGERLNNTNMNWNLTNQGNVSFISSTTLQSKPRPYRLSLFKGFKDNKELSKKEKFVNFFKPSHKKLDPRKFHYRIKDTLFLSDFYKKTLNRIEQRNNHKITYNKYNDSIYKVRLTNWIESEKRIRNIMSERFNMMDTMSVIRMPRNICNYYVTQSIQLRSINCDKYINVPRSFLVKQKINIKPSPDVQTSLVFKNSRSMLSGMVIKNIYEFPISPKLKKANIFVIKYLNDYALIANKSIKTSNKPVHELNFKKVKYKELRKYLSELFI